MQLQLHLAPDGKAMIGADAAGNELHLQLPEMAGGNAEGIRPMQLLLFSVGGCAAVDVLTILKKMRQEVTDLTIDIQAARLPTPPPALWEKVHLIFTVYGAVEQKKAEKAVALSLEKYCSAAETLRRAGTALSWEVELVPMEQEY